MLERTLARETDLAEDRERAERPCRIARVEIRVDGGKAARAEIGDRDRDQPPVRRNSMKRVGLHDV